MIEMTPINIAKPVVAIVMFGPATETSGMRTAEYYQVTLDPAYVSPNGEYIRFGLHPGDEIIGWQRIKALTICEILAAVPEDGKTEIPKTEGPFTMMTIVS